MDYKEFEEYVQERYECMWNIIEEKALNDYALGRAMIKMSKNKKGMSGYLQKRGEKQAKKYQEKETTRRRSVLQLVSGEVHNMIMNDIKKNSKLINKDLKLNSSETEITMKYKFEDYNTNDLSKRVKDVLTRNKSQGINDFDWTVNNNSIIVKIKI